MVALIDEPLFATINVDSSPTTPVSMSPPPKLLRSGGRNVKHMDLSPGGWGLRNAQTRCLGDTQVDAPSPPRKPSKEPEPVGSALAPTSTPQPPMGLPSHEPELVESALPSTPSESKSVDSALPSTPTGTKPVESALPSTPSGTKPVESALPSTPVETQTEAPVETQTDGSTPQPPAVGLSSQLSVPACQPDPSSTQD